MFEHLVRDGTILFLIGVTTLTKVAPAIRQKQYSEEMLKYSIWIGWILTVIGFAFMVTGSVIDSW